MVYQFLPYLGWINFDKVALKAARFGDAAEAERVLRAALDAGGLETMTGYTLVVDWPRRIEVHGSDGGWFPVAIHPVGEPVQAAVTPDPDGGDGMRAGWRPGARGFGS